MKTTVSSVSVKIKSNSSAMKRIGAMIGTITLVKRAHQPAPSIRAASITSVGIAVRPASTVIAPNGTARQVLTKITAAIAGTAVPSQLMPGGVSIPTLTSIQLTTLYWE